MAWVYLTVAGLFEVVWAIALKYTAGFTRLWPSVVTVAGMAASFYFLSMATKTLPIGTAYAVWTGIGALGAVIIGMLFLTSFRKKSPTSKRSESGR
ncbi:DMT family transporter [Geobacillus thermocatenulatus]|uniref:DMT family transporter n=1 Tax=Geobacillus thermocatenulatus TaxID=33938 RepID=UPI00067E10F1|nr:multidrug efflux SMR transporter [Geobacillus thermocatenulatus]KPC98976.1 Quaternary ammonium compound-resistance protein SugE [Geobacillus sp. BCO2]